MAAGVVQWMNIDLADGVTFSNHPDETSDGGWLQVLHSFPQPIFVTAGEHLDLMVGHDRNSLIMMPPHDPAGRRMNKAGLRASGRRTA